MPNSSPFLKEFKDQIIFRLEENTPRIKKCLDLLSEEQVWFQANHESNSVANLILHLSGNIGQYVISSLGHKKDDRNRDLEFRAKGIANKEDLFLLISNTCKKAIQAITDSNEGDLLQFRMVQGFRLSGIGILIHACEHYSYHTGQIALNTKLLVEKDLGFYSDLDLNIKND